MLQTDSVLSGGAQGGTPFSREDSDLEGLLPRSMGLGYEV